MDAKEALKHYRHAIEQAKVAKDDKFVKILMIGAEALEKQVPKEPAAKGLDAKTGDWTIVCPNCEARTQGPRMIPNYCANCGQRIDWGDNNDKE